MSRLTHPYPVTWLEAGDSQAPWKDSHDPGTVAHVESTQSDQSFGAFTCPEAYLGVGDCDVPVDESGGTLGTYCPETCEWAPFANEAQTKIYDAFQRAPRPPPDAVIPGPGDESDDGDSSWRVLKLHILSGQKWGTSSLLCPGTRPFLERVYSGEKL